MNNITKTRDGNELYVWIWIRGIRHLLYKRWIKQGFGKVMDRTPFTAREIDQQKK